MEQQPIMVFNQLYSRTAKGDIEQWTIRVADLGSFSRIITTYGKYLGKLNTNTNDVINGKNLGRSNSTTHFEQACAEANSKYEKKLIDGYKSFEDLAIIVKNPEDAILPVYEFEGQESTNLHWILTTALPKYNTTNTGQAMPMKAQNLFNGANQPRMKLPVMIQPKLNGVRAFMMLLEENKKQRVVVTSKRGIYYDAIDHITAAMPINKFKANLSNFTGKDESDIKLIFDGELYYHGMNLQDIVSACRVKEIMTSQIQYHVYDLAIPNATQEQRIRLLSAIIKSLPIDSPIKFVQTKKVGTWELAKTFYEEKVEVGYEGIMCRTLNGMYAFGQRSSCIMKWKKWYDSEFIIVDVIDTDNAPGLGMFVCKNDRSHDTFSVVPVGNRELRVKYLNEKETYIGKLLTVRYSERTGVPAEIPRHATGLIVRDYE